MPEPNFLENIQNDELSCPRCSSTNIRKAGSQGDKKRYRCANCGKWFVEKTERLDSRHVLPKNIAPNEMRLYDVWDLRVFGKKPSASGNYTLNFTDIHTDWLKSAAKDFIWSKVAIYKTDTLVHQLGSLKHFNEYMEKENIVNPPQINRKNIVNFFNYLASKNLTGRTRSSIISELKNFLDCCQKYKLLEITETQLIFPEDYPKREKSQVKDIPPYILKQLDDNIHHLARPIALQVKILRETGMRVSEVCGLKINCIQSDSDGDWWINVYREKMEKENRLLITKNLAQEVIEQQKFISSEVSSDFAYLFCNTEAYSWFAGYKHQIKKQQEEN